MILQQLYHDAGRILKEDLAPPMYDWKPVRWVIRLEQDGRFMGIQSLGGDKENKRGKPYLVPYLGRTSGVRAILIADTPAYVLGRAFEDKEKRAAEKHADFKTLIKKCAEETGDPDVAVIDAFLTQWNPSTPLPTEAAAMTAADLVTFRVGARMPTDNPDVQAFWAKTARPEPEKGGFIGECLVTGQIGPLESSLPGMLKRIPGGQAAGLALVSANCAAFESFGWKGGHTSPVSREAAERFTKALNRLIEGDRTHITIGGLVYVFWTKQGGDEVISLALDRPEDSQVRDTIAAVLTGKQNEVLKTDAFHGLALSASGGRAVVRDWITTTVGNAYANVEKWFQAQEIVMSDGTDGPPLGVRKFARAAYRDPAKDATLALTGALIRTALHGDPVPQSLLDKTVLRCRAERRVTRAQAALIKACLVTDPSRIPSEKEQLQRMTQLDAPKNDPAYLCGRLLAELDYVQYAALGKINATLVDRYFGAASTAPATVFGLLLTHANKAHLPKLRKSKPGVYQALQKRLEEILAPTLEQPLGLKEFPATLTLQQQGLFALGFYHQRAADRTAAREAKARKDEALAELPETTDDATTNDTDGTEE